MRCAHAGGELVPAASSLAAPPPIVPRVDVPPKDRVTDVIALHRDHIEFLAGKANADGKLPGNFSVRRDKKDGSDGTAVSHDSDKGFWEVGLFTTKQNFMLLQTVRRRESVCQ
jgi:hypothetical protein